MSLQILPLESVADKLGAWHTSAVEARRKANDPDSQAKYDALVRQYEQLALSVRAAVDTRPAPAVRQASRRAPAAGRALTAEDFWSRYRLAVAAINERYGNRWSILAPIGETVLATVPGRWRSYVSARGTTIRYRADHRMPGAMYWPGGELPPALATTADYDRQDPTLANLRTLQNRHRVMLADLREALRRRGHIRTGNRGYWTEEAHSLIKRIREVRAEIIHAEESSAPERDEEAWCEAHGYVKHAGAWCQPQDARRMLALEEHHRLDDLRNETNRAHAEWYGDMLTADHTTMYWPEQEG